MASLKVAQTQALARTLKALHKPSSPIIFANIWDKSSLNTLLSLNASSSNTKPVKAIATASFAIAKSLGIEDAELTMDQNLTRIAELSPIARNAGLPLTADLQDGYGEDITSCVKKAIVEGGVAGANIEDLRSGNGYDVGLDGLYSVDEQVSRLKTALAAARDAGAEDFVINARTDVFMIQSGLSREAVLQEAVKRGKAYLAAGATTVFVWGGPTVGLRDTEIKALVEAFEGRLAVIASGKSDGLTTNELGELGVARISIGPGIWRQMTALLQETAGRLFKGGRLAVP